MNEFVVQLDEEVEGMQATICTLQQQLKEAKSHSQGLENKNQELLLKIEKIDSNFQSDISRSSNLRKAEYEHSPKEFKQEPMNFDEFSKSPDSPMKHVSIDYEGVSNDSFTNQEDELIDNFRSGFDERTCSPVIPNHTEIQVKTDPSDLMEVEQSTHIDISHTANHHITHNSEDLELKSLPNQLSKQFSTNESLNELHLTHQRISPNKTSTKTSFSINDLLSDTKEGTRKEPLDVTTEVVLGLKNEENGTENGTLNGVIDDTAI